ncbi:hypothetical protein phytr_5580 [Candidatus Phycorickettsia trachydisci]|uniref:Uncharacterized protein n=1 Tax=Candidatus Phycorickettsia trachydisci TaxID=2115978 RepID=A0A2P1P8A7_9RICK|nr:ankyrin repeat domain-containing protein [Candidatus Phycorickettsia trachydisci]AVP87502.1 hypothetical protein phytr_5580 [Candidatus Phycorickettsia trachydisci]
MFFRRFFDTKKLSPSSKNCVTLIDEIMILIKKEGLENWLSNLKEHTSKTKAKIKALKKQGADINPQDLETGLTVLHFICAGLLENSLLNEFEASHIINPPNFPLLHTAAEKNNIKAISWLLEKGQNINLQNSHGDTPLHWAVSSGRFEAVELLLKNHADFTIKSQEGHTALHDLFLPEARESTSISRFFEPADAEDTDKAKLKILALLMYHGSNVNEVDKSGSSVLEQAASIEASISADPLQKELNRKLILLLLNKQDLNIPLSVPLIHNLLTSIPNITQLFSINFSDKVKTNAINKVCQTLENCCSPESTEATKFIKEHYDLRETTPTTELGVELISLVEMEG